MKSIVAGQHPAVLVVLGVLMTLALMFITGAAVGDHPSGRYELFCVVRGNFTDVYVIDTATGAVKWLGDDIGKPFEAVKGK